MASELSFFRVSFPQKKKPSRLYRAFFSPTFIAESNFFILLPSSFSKNSHKITVQFFFLLHCSFSKQTWNCYSTGDCSRDTVHPGHCALTYAWDKPFNQYWILEQLTTWNPYPQQHVMLFFMTMLVFSKISIRGGQLEMQENGMVTWITKISPQIHSTTTHFFQNQLRPSGRRFFYATVALVMLHLESWNRYFLPFF
jgi:hypothetical protein